VPLVVVVRPGEDEVEAIEGAKAAAHTQADGHDDDKRRGEILFEESELILTGVPRHDDFGKWKHEHLKPQYPDRYAATAPPPTRPRKDNGGDAPEPALSEWKSVRVQIAAPNENTGDPGRVIEAEYVAVGNVTEGYEPTGTGKTRKSTDDSQRSAENSRTRSQRQASGPTYWLGRKPGTS